MTMQCTITFFFKRDKNEGKFPSWGNLPIYKLITNDVLTNLSSPRGAWDFNELRRYHTRPSQFNWGPENVHFGNPHFRDPNIDARVFDQADITWSVGNYISIDLE